MRQIRVLFLSGAVLLAACQLLLEPSDGRATEPVPPAAASIPPPEVPRQRTVRPATKPFAFPGPAESPGSASCRFAGLALPANVKIYAAGGYRGAPQTFQIDQSGNEATRMDVAVNQPSAPVVLMLGSYEPTVWNVGWSPGTRILAVLVSGYHRQVVNGLPASVPRIVSTHDHHGACPSFSLSSGRTASLNPAAREVFGRNVDMVFPAHDGKVLVNEAGIAADRWLTDRSARPVESFRLIDMPLAGEAGLLEAMRQGYLREATPADAHAWQAAAQAARGTVDAPPVYGGERPTPISLYHAYVVLKPFTLPAGLYGAHSATFFVPKGVPRPQGTLGHSTLYDFNTLSCTGTMCRH